MHTLFANLTRRSVAIGRKPFRHCVLAGLAVAALGWPDIGNAQTLAVHVQGNQLVNQNGALVHLRGVDFSGAEYAALPGNGGDPHNELGYGIFDWPGLHGTADVGPTPALSRLSAMAYQRRPPAAERGLLEWRPASGPGCIILHDLGREGRDIHRDERRI